MKIVNDIADQRALFITERHAKTKPRLVFIDMKAMHDLWEFFYCSGMENYPRVSREKRVFIMGLEVKFDPAAAVPRIEE